MYIYMNISGGFWSKMCVPLLPQWTSTTTAQEVRAQQFVTAKYVCMCMYVCIYVCMYVCMYVCVCIYVCM